MHNISLERVASGCTLPDHTKIICGKACAQHNALASLYFVFSYPLGRRSQGRIITHIGCHKSVDNLTVSIATCHLMWCTKFRYMDTWRYVCSLCTKEDINITMHKSRGYFAQGTKVVIAIVDLRQILSCKAEAWRLSTFTMHPAFQQVRTMNHFPLLSGTVCGASCHMTPLAYICAWRREFKNWNHKVCLLGLYPSLLGTLWTKFLAKQLAEHVG